MNDWYKACEHGQLNRHWWKFDKVDCPGGSLVTSEDLEALGEKVWFCGTQYVQGTEEYCVLTSSQVHFPRCGWRLVIE